MTLSIDEKLHSEAPTVAIEAAAGYGKTTKAAAYACHAADRLKSGRVLLLSHTHAACGEFHRKCEDGNGRRKVDIETCDSFCLKVIGAYAAPLGLPFPIDAHLGRADNCVQFADLSKKACELFKRTPTVAKAIARHYPIIILDEHQDASLSQHQSVTLLRELGGARLRFFGDPMQAIHVRNRQGYVDFERLWSEAEERDRLQTPHRWSDAPDLGEWIRDCRSRLRAGNPISLRDAPQSVTVHLHSKFAGRKKFIDARGASSVIHGFLNDSSASAAILAFSVDMARSAAEMSRWRASLNEGAQLDMLDDLLEALERYGGSARQLALSLLDFLGTIGTGLPRDLRASLAVRLGETVNIKGIGQRQKVWLEHLQAIYLEPNHRGIAAAMRTIQRSPPDGYTIRLRHHSWAVCSFSRTDDPRAFRSTLGRIRRQWKQNVQIASTIHKAKGLDFENVLLCPVDEHQYPEDQLGARLLYVALSRARKAISLVVETKTGTLHVAKS